VALDRSGSPDSGTPSILAASRIDPQAPSSLFLLWAVVVVALVARLVVTDVQALPLHFDEAQYYGWSLAPDWGYYSKPPMVAWAIAAGTAICGDSEACIRAPAAVALAVAAILAGLLAARLAGANAAPWAGFAVATMPLVVFFGGAMTTDSLLLLAWTAALYAMVRACPPSGAPSEPAWWLVCGLAAGVGLLSKYSFVLFAITAIAWLAVDPVRRRALRTPWPWAGAGVALLVWSPNLAWNLRHGFATVRHTAELAQAGGTVAPLQPARLLEFAAAQPILLGVPVAVAAAIAWSTPARRHGPLAALGWHVFWPTMGLIAAQALFTRAHANWAAPALLGAALAASGVLAAGTGERGRRRRLVAAAVTLNLAFAALIATGPALAGRLPAGLAHLDPYARLAGWRELGAAVGAQLQARPGAMLIGPDRRELSALTYYARPHAFPASAWNPERTRTDHYRLTGDVADRPGAASGTWIFVAREGGYDPAVMRAAFDLVGPLRVFEAPVGSHRPQRYHVLEVRGFRGYAAR